MNEEPVIGKAIIDGEEIEVKYSMLSRESKCIWDSGKFHDGLVKNVSFKLEAEIEPAVPAMSPLICRQCKIVLAVVDARFRYYCKKCRIEKGWRSNNP